MKKTYIWVTFQKEGIHKYPAAAELQGVEFLQYPHRHIFHFNVQVEVFHDDRDLEFILFKRELEALYDEGVMELDFKSCEMMGNDIIKYVQTNYPNRDIEVTVSEDGENGATIVCPWTNNKSGSFTLNPTEGEDDFVETAGGNWKTEIDLDELVIDPLIDSWIEQHCDAATIEQYHEIKRACDITTAVHGAIVNEIIIEALKIQIDHMEKGKYDES